MGPMTPRKTTSQHNPPLPNLACAQLVVGKGGPWLLPHLMSLYGLQPSRTVIVVGAALLVWFCPWPASYLNRVWHTYNPHTHAPHPFPVSPLDKDMATHSPSLSACMYHTQPTLRSLFLIRLQGDRLDTDVALGKEGGLWTIVPLTGEPMAHGSAIAGCA